MKCDRCGGIREHVRVIACFQTSRVWVEKCRDCGKEFRVECDV
jgi:hypothetical protein